jgi:hypothetical protein
MNYVTYYNSTQESPIDTAMPYLLSATSISMVMPDLRDDAIAKKWYGASSNAASADVVVKRHLPRTIIKNYAVDAMAYHTARYRFAEHAPANFMQTMSVADMQSGGNDFLASCATCHGTGIFNLNTSDSQINNCRGLGTCSIIAYTKSMYEANYMLDTPTSQWANSVLTPMETLPAAMNSTRYEYMWINTSVKSEPRRIPLLRRSALGLWSYLDYEQAIRPKAQRHAPAYGLVSAKLGINRSVELRAIPLNFDFDKNGIIGQEKMFCLQSDRFDLDKNGTLETSCFDAIQTLSGGTPRPIGQSDSLEKVHDLIYSPLTDATRRANLAKILAAYADGGLNVIWENGTKTQIKFNPEVGGSGSGSGSGSGY